MSDAIEEGEVGVNFYDDFRRLLEEHDVSQKQVAKAVNVSPQTINDLYHERRTLNVKMSIKIGDYFDFDGSSRSWDWLVNQLHKEFKEEANQCQK